MLTSIPQRTFATKLKAGATKKTKDSIGRRLGIKRFGGEEVYPGEILVRQRGFQWTPGENTYYGKDHTIHAKVEGKIAFTKDPYRRRKKTYIHVVTGENPNKAVQNPPPFVYHPELFPDMAPNNPQPIVLDIRKKGCKPHKRNPRPLGAQVCESQSDLNHFLEVRMKMENYSKYSDLAFNNQPEIDLMEDEIERDVASQFKKYF